MDAANDNFPVQGYCQQSQYNAAVAWLMSVLRYEVEAARETAWLLFESTGWNMTRLNYVSN